MLDHCTNLIEVIKTLIMVQADFLIEHPNVMQTIVLTYPYICNVDPEPVKCHFSSLNVRMCFMRSSFKDSGI